MDIQELEQQILDVSERLIEYKDSKAKEVLEAYKQLLDKLLGEVNKMYVDTNLQGEWNWDAIASADRIEFLFSQVRTHLSAITVAQMTVLKVALENVVKVDYAMGSYLLAQQARGWVPVIPIIPQKTLDAIMKVPWSGDHFSDRIHHNTQLLKTTLRRELISSVVSGESVKKTTARLQEKLELDAYKAERLVRSEIIAASNRAQKEVYKEFNRKYAKYDMLSGFIVLETLDRRTCNKCRAVDGKAFMAEEMDNVKDIEHPNCRRRLVPIIDGFDEQSATRAARDADGKYYRTTTKNFEEYAKEQGIPFEYRQTEKEKQEAATRAQYKRYKERLPDLPNYSVFASQKARGTSKYDEWQEDYRAVGKVIKSQGK